MFQISTGQMNARLSAMVTDAGASPKLRIYTGTIPANCAAARTGTVLSEIQLPATWMNAPSNGSMSMTGTWSDSSADAAGTAGYWTLLRADGTTVCQQGDISATGGGGSMTIDNIVFAAGQAFTITAFTISDNNG